MRFLVFAVVCALLWLFFLRRANELCAIELTEDRCRLIRGRAPAALLSDFREIARRAALPTFTVRVVLESGSPLLLPPPGLDEAIVQQLRNVTGQYRTVHFRTGRRT